MFKVLVIAANPFSDINNNGKTLKSIFSSFERDELCELYFRPQDNIIGDGLFASSYYAVAEMDIIRAMFCHSKTCGGIQVFDEKKDYEVANDKVYRRFLNGKIKDVRWLRNLLWKTRVWDTKAFRDWYQSCNPDIVFALLGGPGAMFTISEEISRTLNIPLAIYFTDDYLLHLPRKSFIDRIKYRNDLKAFNRIIEHSSIRFCIGEMMCQAYSDFFGMSFFPIMNGVDIKPFECCKTQNVKPRLSYFGSLWLDRWKMLVRLSELVGNDADIYVYSNSELDSKMKEAIGRTGIILCPPVVGDDYKSAIMHSDILLHVESDAKENIEKTALSISTKIPEYLVSGKPILAYGPKEIASMRLIFDNAIGFFVSSEEGEEANKERLSLFIHDEKLHNSLILKAYAFAVNSFDKKKTSDRIRIQLTQVADAHRSDN